MIGGGGSHTITYTYDALNRLVAADYTDGRYFHYSYDAVGNRLSQMARLAPNQEPVTTIYGYDAANRLVAVNGASYSWDANGNLLDDGGSTYTYDDANRLVEVTSGEASSTYVYNGLGDRVSQTANGQTTTYHLDLASGLTQVLDDGQHTYLYGNGRIGYASDDIYYYLGDALGSVREIVQGDADGPVVMTRDYTPYGEVLSQTGEDQSRYGFTGEMFDAETGLVFLRARYYNPYLARFTSRDIWKGEAKQPMSYDAWLYAYANPINDVDPTGYSPNCANKGTCGPDVTTWLMNEMSNHYDYGKQIRTKMARMKALARTITGINPCSDLFTFLSFVAIEPPFNQIVREFNFPKTSVPIGITPLVTPDIANKIIDTLGLVEYAAYGLAVDYSNITYYSPSSSCNTGSCGQIINTEDNNPHQVVSLCGECRDVSDFGNMMFGLGGAVRGYSWPTVLASALLFNGLADDPRDAQEFIQVTIGSADGYGALPGWIIGSGVLYNNRNMFCAAANIPVIGRDNSNQITGCQACNSPYEGEKTTANSIQRVSGLGGPNTIIELQNKFDNFVDKIFGK